jgi:DNA-binding winged helix-turn-helix (wHTH) protein/tetratricopeptide (TPR) repeat protein
MTGGGPGLYEFDRFRLDTRRRVLQRDGEVVPLTPKAFDVLSVLVASHGRIVEKSEILEAVWPRTSVEDGNLTVNISIIRRALGESRSEHTFIATVPGRGYQFVCDVHHVAPLPQPPVAVAALPPPTRSVPPGPLPAATARPSGPQRRPFRWLRAVVASAALLAVGLLAADGRLGTFDQASSVEDPDARVLYLRGRFLLSRRTEASLEMGLRYFERAIERAPEYASAYSGLADAHSMQAYFGVVPPGVAHTRARDAARRALALDPDSAEAHTSMAYIFHRFEWNWAEAERNFRQAIALDPAYALAHHWYAAFLDARGRKDEAIAEGRRAEMLDPLSPVISAKLLQMQQPDGSADFFERGHRLIEMDSDFWLSHWSIGRVYHSRGQHSLALEEYERAAELAGRGTYVLTRLGVAYATAGRTAEAWRVLRELDGLGTRRYVSPFARVPILAALGQHDEAFAWLGRAYDERSTQLAFIGVELVALRSDPRFEGYLTRVGLR